MKGIAVLVWMIIGVVAQAQRSVQTIVPLQPIVVGNAFQVQYIVTDAEPAVELQSPAFGKDFRFVSGPHLYQGEAMINNTKIPIQNFSYTLIPLRKGRLVVKGATAVFKNRKVKSNDTQVMVTDVAQTDPLTATPLSNLPRLAPGAGWQKAVQEEIFIKTVVSKQSCFVGEPVVATFTLFSKLPSASEVIKNPGFYGFSVAEMPDVAEGAATVQTYNGSFYNTHILRKVQLYPAQAGTLAIDKMSVNNAIEYADSASGAPVQTEVVLESKPVTITVKPLPATETFTEAVGSFSIKAQLEQPQWNRNTNGKLNVTISGSGNFLQLTAPDIHWPVGLDVFDPILSERLQKEAVPLSGSRTYTYTITTDSAGAYTMPPILFTYFNPAEKKYQTAATDSVHFTVLQAQAKHLFPVRGSSHLSGTPAYVWVLSGVALLLLAGGIWFKKFREKATLQPVSISENKTPDFEAQINRIDPTASDAYRQLQQQLMGVLKSYGVSLSSGAVQPAAFSLPADQHQRAQTILRECEAVQYYNAAPTMPFTELQKQALHVVRSLQQANASGRT